MFYPKRNLIFDFGANDGGDSEFYLEKGFKVVAVEANPELAQSLRTKFSSAIKNGHYVIIDKALAEESGKRISFYVNQQNSHWSSSIKVWGARDDTKFKEIEVETISVKDILNKFGCPYYLKIDVEGIDLQILRDLSKLRSRPEFISTEENRVETIDLLASLGYGSFTLVNQQLNHNQVNPKPSLEGRYVNRQHSGVTSGLFGLELPGPWQNLSSFRKRYLEEVRNENGDWVCKISGAWHDVHAKRKLTSKEKFLRKMNSFLYFSQFRKH
jgi:FkbM family methyltransferase